MNILPSVFLLSECDVTLVLAADRDQRFHRWRGTPLSHGSPVKREEPGRSQLPLWAHTKAAYPENQSQDSLIQRLRRNRETDSGYVQKLRPLGEAHGVVSSLQVRVLSQLAADHGHLLIHVLEKPVFCVLQGGKRDARGSERDGSI